MKKINITKKQYDESRYFTKKYGALKYVSESGKLFKTDKGVVLALEGKECQGGDCAYGQNQENESLSDIGDAIKKTGGEMVDKVKKGVKKAATAVGDKFHGIYRKGDRVKIAGKAGEVDGAVVSAEPDKVVIKPDNERSFDESDAYGQNQENESLSDIGDAIKKTGGEMVDKVKKGVKKAATAVGDKFHGIYRKGDRVKIAGKAGEVDGAVVSAEPDKVVIKPDNERSFDESDAYGSEEVTRGELTDMLKDVVDTVEKVCDAQDCSFEEVLGIEPEGEAEDADSEEVIATKDEVAEVLQDVIEKVEDVAEKAGIELPEDDKQKALESVKKAHRARLVKEAIARRARAKKIRESVARRARLRKIHESIAKRRHCS